jgi:Cu+-exporting ATPase
MTEAAPVFGAARDTRPCASCGTAVDPLRAERVAYVRERFRYFCSVACRERFDVDPHLTPLPLPRARGSERPGGVRTPIPTPLPTPLPERNHQTARALADVGRKASAGEEIDRLPRAARRSRHPEPPADSAADARGASASGLLLTLAGLGSALALGLSLAGTSRTVLAARVVLAAVACAALVTERATGQRDRSELHPAVFSAAPIAAAGVAWGTLLLGDPRTAEAITLTSFVVGFGALSAALLRRARRPILAARERIALALSGACRRVVEDGTVQAHALDLRPGEEILVEAGDLVPADASVTAGEGVIFPWLDAKVAADVHEGDTILAGARLAEGRIRAVVGWSGDDRAYARLTNDTRRRADLLAPVARAGRLFAERGSLLITGLAALTAFAAGLDGVEILLVAVAVQAALRVADTVLGGLRRGVVWKSAEALDRAGHTSVAVFCARGTLLLGEPEVATIEAFGAHTPEEVLALVAGAESGEHHPVASAVVRAARARGIRPDSVRSPQAQAGLGITAIASNGQPLVVGTRALLLYEHVSVAIAERRIQELESMGQTVLLLAIAQRLVGLVGLQDGLRPGARAAVQHLLDAGLEPALLSSDARETCEALGRALAIDHVRPEVPPAERGEEIKRLVGGGATVAVIGQSPADDAALSAADVAVALKSAGSTAADFSIHLATDDVRDAAFALYSAKQCLRQARIDLALCGLPAFGLTAVAALGMLPPAWVPALASFGALLALRRSAADA